MPTFECPSCDEEIEVDCGDIPSNACDDKELDCPHCAANFSIGWVAEIEIRRRPVARQPRCAPPLLYSGMELTRADEDWFFSPNDGD